MYKELNSEEIRVHRRSSMPARLNAEAYAQGGDIYLGPGQDKHLAHELGHVVQQRRGQVRPTGKIGGVDVNENPALEREADSLGSRIESGALAMPQAAAPQNAPAQMAGHAGVMVFSRDGKILKRVEKNEYTEFKRVMEMQNDGDEGAGSAFPRIFGVYDTRPQMSQRTTVAGEYKPEKFDPWAAAHAEGDYYVEMASVKSHDPDARVLDFKVGNRTAITRELMQNHGFSEKKARKKDKKMGWRDDALTETGKYGLRDSDRTQDKLDAVLRFCKVFHHTLRQMQAELAGQQYAEDSQLARDLDSIRGFFESSDTVYVASSVIMSYSGDRNKKNSNDRAKLIDLAHPVRKSEFPPGEFEDIKRGMVAGIDNVKRMMLGQPLVPVAQMGSIAEAAEEGARQRSDTVFEDPGMFAVDSAGAESAGRERSDTVFEHPDFLAPAKKKKWWQRLLRR